MNPVTNHQATWWQGKGLRASLAAFISLFAVVALSAPSVAGAMDNEPTTPGKGPKSFCWEFQGELLCSTLPDVPGVPDAPPGEPGGETSDPPTQGPIAGGGGGGVGGEGPGPGAGGGVVVSTADGVVRNGSGGVVHGQGQGTPPGGGSTGVFATPDGAPKQSTRRQTWWDVAKGVMDQGLKWLEREEAEFWAASTDWMNACVGRQMGWPKGVTACEETFMFNAKDCSVLNAACVRRFPLPPYRNPMRPLDPWVTPPPPPPLAP